ncbi:MAG: TIGR02186 family protein [Rickettsiales bacterium]|nr:TIGR02186 family protein [Rickettsiales bacterium]
MMRLLLASLIMICAALPALAVPIASDISSHKIEIHSGFTGTEILLFGARNDPGDIVVVIRGPAMDMTVRKKERTAGIWINSGQAYFNDVPEFYGVASSKPLKDIRQYRLYSPLDIIDSSSSYSDPYKEALYRLLRKKSLYDEEVGTVEFMGETLFKTRFSFPDNMPRGTYTAEIYLFSDGLLSGAQAIPIQVYKTGFDAFVYDAAHNHSVLYGLVAVALAVGIGWFAGWLFQRI